MRGSGGTVATLTWPQMALAAVVALLVLANGTMYLTYRPIATERDLLIRQVDTLERTVRRLRDRGAQASAIGPLPGENPFPADLPSAELTALVVQSGQGAGVRIDAMAPQLGAGERLVRNSYRSYRISLRAYGTAAQTADFLGRIERGTVRTWVIDNVAARPSADGTWEIAFDVIAYAPLRSG